MAKPIYLSASRLDTFTSCSQLYAAKYLWHIPDGGNDGSNRGSVVHEVLEFLLKPRHRKRYDQIMTVGNCQGVVVIWKLVQRLATRFNVNDPVNLKMIDDFIMVALKQDFFGPKGTKEILGEKEFSIQVNEDGKKFNIRGKIDKTFVIKEKGVSRLETVDYKSSKTRHTGDKLDNNMQSLMYQLALKREYPAIKERSFKFLFLKFKNDPIQEQPTFTDAQLDGFEWQLTELQNQVDSFYLKSSGDNLALFSEEKKWMCGGEGLKKDGTVKWICPARRPMDFFVLLDKEGEFLKSAMTEEELKPEKGQIVVPRHYPGCVGHFNPDTGKRRNFQ